MLAVVSSQDVRRRRIDASQLRLVRLAGDG